MQFRILSLCFTLVLNSKSSDTATAKDLQQGCPSKSIITVVGAGRTANCIWEYLAVYFASKYLPHGQIPYSRQHIKTYLSPIFDNLSLPVLEDIPKTCEVKLNTDWNKNNTNDMYFKPLDTAFQHYKNTTGNIVLQKCLVLIEPMERSLKEVKQILPYRKELVNSTQNTLRRIKEDYFKKTNISGVIFVGVHVRRSDFMTLLKRYSYDIAESKFYHAAMQYFRKRTDLGHPVFVITSDDLKWSEENLLAPDVYIHYEGESGFHGSPGKDMALLSSCNHSIVDYGTFGMWVAIYTEGEVITVYQGKTQFWLTYRNNPKWHFVNITQENIVVT